MPANPPAAGAAPGQPPQAAPFGASPVTGPTPNKGFEAAAVQRLGLVIKQLTDLLGLAGAGSDIGKDILKMLNIATKHVPPGAVTPAAEKNNIERMAMQNAQQGQQAGQMRAQMAGGQPGGAPPAGMPAPKAA